jgi:hypothetical protein
MNKGIIEIEGESLEEARAQVKAQIPEGFRLLSEEVISDGTHKAVKAMAETIETAFERARREVPEDADIVRERELTKPEHKTIIVEAFDEESAQASAKLEVRNQFSDTGLFKELKLVTPGSKGFLGIGRKPNRYEVKIVQQAVVEVTYKTKAKIAVRLAEALKWGEEPPDLLALLLDREPPGGSQAYRMQLIATFPKDSVPATVASTVVRDSSRLTSENWIRYYAISAANAHGVLPDMERTVWQEVPPLGGEKGTMIAVYENKELVKSLSGDISGKRHDFQDANVVSSSLCVSDAETADQYYKDFIAWSRLNRPPVPVTVCRINSSGVRYPCFVTRFYSKADKKAQDDWNTSFYRHQKEEGRYPLGTDFATLTAPELFRGNPVVAVECTYIEPSATDT